MSAQRQKSQSTQQEQAEATEAVEAIEEEVGGPILVHKLEVT